MKWIDVRNKIVLKLPRWIKKLIFRRGVSDPIKEVLEEWEEQIYDESDYYKVLEKIRGNKEYIDFALQVRMRDSAYRMEKLTKWIITLTILMFIGIGLQIGVLIYSLSV